MAKINYLLYLNKLYFENICRYCNESNSICKECQYNIDDEINKERKMIKLINLTECTTKELRMVWKWRNHPDIAKFMLNPKKFTFKKHLEFIDSLKSKPDKLFYIVKFKDNYLGLIDFYDLQHDVGFWGYYLNPEYINTSYGVLLEYLVCEYAFNTLNLVDLKCETLNFNTRALKIHTEFGFEMIGNSFYGKSISVIIHRLTKDKWKSNKHNFKFIERFFND